jgi:hypothetical protein
VVQCIVSLFLTGAAMTAATQEPPKKEELPPLKAPFTERVKFEQIDPKTKAVEWSAENVDAGMVGKTWHLRSGTKFVKIKPLAGSRFTTDKGDVWVVETVRLVNTTTPAKYIVTAKKQEPAEKKVPPKKSSPRKL